MIKVYDWYRKIYFERSEQFLWAGMARLAGKTVFAAMAQLSIAGSGSGEKAIIRAREILAEMQKDIFLDLGWQHMAYKSKGIDEMFDRLVAGELDPTNYLAWCWIDSGVESKIWKGNTILLKREQESILREGYVELSALGDQGISEMMSRMAKSPIPGAYDFRDLYPEGNLTSFDDRWQWISGQMIWDYRRLTKDARDFYIGSKLGSKEVYGQ